MTTELSRLEWIEILNNTEITKEIDLSILQTVYAFENHKTTSKQIGKLLGYGEKSPQSTIHLELKRYAERIAKHYKVEFSVRKSGKLRARDLFFHGWKEGKRFIWQLKENLIEAIEESELTGIEQYPEEIPLDEAQIFNEGMKKTVVVDRYERHPKARAKCIEYWKCTCSVCEFDFEKVFGDLGKGFIHVHHLTPLSEIGKEYEVDPIKDLRPICPNCHAMIHRENPPLTIEQLKLVINKNR